jgi:hypothetical protein
MPKTERADGVKGVPTVPSYQKRSAPTGSLAHGRIRAAYVRLELHGNQNFQEFFRLFPQK